jgi:hypothetical protein
MAILLVFNKFKAVVEMCTSEVRRTIDQSMTVTSNLNLLLASLYKPQIVFHKNFTDVTVNAYRDFLHVTKIYFELITKY